MPHSNTFLRVKDLLRYAKDDRIRQLLNTEDAFDFTEDPTLFTDMAMEEEAKVRAMFESKYDMTYELSRSDEGIDAYNQGIHDAISSTETSIETLRTTTATLTALAANLFTWSQSATVGTKAVRSLVPEKPDFFHIIAVSDTTLAFATKRPVKRDETYSVALFRGSKVDVIADGLVEPSVMQRALPTALQNRLVGEVMERKTDEEVRIITEYEGLEPGKLYYAAAFLTDSDGDSRFADLDIFTRDIGGLLHYYDIEKEAVSSVYTTITPYRTIVGTTPRRDTTTEALSVNTNSVRTSITSINTRLTTLLESGQKILEDLKRPNSDLTVVERSAKELVAQAGTLSMDMKDIIIAFRHLIDDYEPLVMEYQRRLSDPYIPVTATLNEEGDGIEVRFRGRDIDAERFVYVLTAYNTGRGRPTIRNMMTPAVQSDFDFGTIYATAIQRVASLTEERGQRVLTLPVFVSKDYTLYFALLDDTGNTSVTRLDFTIIQETEEEQIDATEEEKQETTITDRPVDDLLPPELLQRAEKLAMTFETEVDSYEGSLTEAQEALLEVPDLSTDERRSPILVSIVATRVMMRIYQRDGVQVPDTFMKQYEDCMKFEERIIKGLAATRWRDVDIDGDGKPDKQSNYLIYRDRSKF